jgi:integrase/recombinase XerD
VNTPCTFPSLLQAFFTERLMAQQQASGHTVGSYRDTFRLLLSYVRSRLKKEPSRVALEDLNAPLIIDFLNDLEERRGNGSRTRNVRLAAIRSFFRYAALQEPGLAGLIQAVLAIPSKRWHRPLINFLSRPEVEALLAAPDRDTHAGHRDRALLLLAVQTGLRVSELIGLRRNDVALGPAAHVHCLGKGRKERCVPLAKETVKAIQCWLKGTGLEPEAPLFPNARGGPLSRDGVEYILKKHKASAGIRCPSLRRKKVSPHVLRHTTAVNLLQSGVDQAVIALWLGHESVETTHIYLDADLSYKEKVLAKAQPLNARPGVYRADDQLLTFLRNL